jgi:hypothetical protein
MTAACDMAAAPMKAAQVRAASFVFFGFMVCSQVGFLFVSGEIFSWRELE